jgi:molecular chaperone GrpE
MPSSRASDQPQQHDHAPEQPEQPAQAQVPERDLSAELAKMEDRFKRAVADLDNYRKRAARDIERLSGERSDRVLLDWLEVVDALDRAMAQTPDGPLREGLQAVVEQVEAILARQGIRRIGQPGEPFDPSRHEAVEVRETDEAPARSVIAVLRSGFARGDRMLRPAQVVVAREPQPQT